MLSLSASWYRFCPECGFPVGRDARRGRLGVHAGRNRHELCAGHKTPFRSLPAITREQWRAYWMSFATVPGQQPGKDGGG